jgi:response regulator RpfG family c-di-GMP phosphodiesterase
LKNILGRSVRERSITLAAGVLGALLLVLSWGDLEQPVPFPQVGLAILLFGWVVLADRFPIHIRYGTKVSLISMPLYLVMALLPLPLALSAAGLAILVTDFFSRAERGLSPVDFIQDPARWILIVSASSTLLHLSGMIGISLHLMLVIAAAVMYVLDVVTFSVITSLCIHDSVIDLMRDITAQSFEIESVQYLTGILGALAFEEASWSLLLLLVPIVLAYQIFKRAKEMNRSTRELLVTMADTVDLRDPYTGGHSRRVAEITSRILDHMQISGAEAELINTAARLHDIGKIGISDEILLKPGTLTDEEWVVMRSHPQKGAELLGRYVDFVRGHDMVLYHHERWDGKGYPRGMMGSEIPFGARVIAAADAFDAITTDRPYRKGKTLREAAEILADGRGTQWNAEVVDALLATLQDELGEKGSPLEVAQESAAG